MRKPTKKQMIIAANVLNWMFDLQYRKADIENEPEFIIRLMLDDLVE